MRIVVVEDDPSVRGLLVAGLELEGHEVTVAEDGSAGLAVIRETRPDAVVCDVMMPALSGWDLVTALRSEADFATLPVVLLSARDSKDDVRHGYESGASVVLGKPFDARELHELLTTLAANRP